MMKYITKIILGTPWKVWIILYYLIHTGIKAIKPQTIGLPKLLILPLIVTGLSVAGVLKESNNIQPEIWSIYLPSLIIGGIIGWLIFRNTHLIVDRTQRLVTLPGGYSTLILLMGIFILNYFWAYMKALHPDFFSIQVIHLKMASSAILAGLAFGRSITYFYKFFKSS